MSGVITLKLTSLLIRTISKPVANAIKHQSRQSPLLKSNFIKFGQFINRIDLRLRNNANVKVRPLNDNKAIEIGSNFLSEMFVFSVAAGLIIYELVKPKKDKAPDPMLTELSKEVDFLKAQTSQILVQLLEIQARGEVATTPAARAAPVDGSETTKESAPESNTPKEQLSKECKESTPLKQHSKGAQKNTSIL